MATHWQPGRRAPGGSRSRVLFTVGVAACGVAACVTVLFLSMRETLELGGFVASGGPYEIAHPAPDWVWVVPTSIIVGFAFGGLHVVSSLRLGSFSGLKWIWSALFLALGWNFLEYGLRPPEGMDSTWGWIFCGVVFVAMGAGPLIGSRVIPFPDVYIFDADTPDAERQALRTRYRGVHAVAVPAGIAAGYFFFSSLAG